MDRIKKIKTNALRRKARTRSRIFGTGGKPRLSIFRSNRNIHAQLIDDERGSTLAAVSSKVILRKGVKKTEAAHAVGKRLAEEAKKLNIEGAILDRGSYRYHGRVKALCEGARSAGLKI